MKPSLLHTFCYRNKKTGKLHLHNMKGCSPTSCEWVKIRTISDSYYVKLYDSVKLKAKK